MPLLSLKRIEMSKTTSRWFLCAATFWAICTFAGGSSLKFEDEAKELVGLLAVEAGDSFADVGAGNGEWIVPFAKVVGEQGHIYATEIEEDKVRKIERTAADNDLNNVTAILGAQDSIGLAANCCDAILLRLVYHHFEDPKPMHAGLSSALRQGGRIAIIDFGPGNSFPLSNVPEFRHGHGVEAKTVINEMKASGFHLIEHRENWADHGDRYLLVFQK